MKHWEFGIKLSGWITYGSVMENIAYGYNYNVKITMVIAIISMDLYAKNRCARESNTRPDPLPTPYHHFASHIIRSSALFRAQHFIFLLSKSRKIIMSIL